MESRYSRESARYPSTRNKEKGRPERLALNKNGGDRLLISGGFAKVVHSGVKDREELV